MERLYRIVRSEQWDDYGKVALDAWMNRDGWMAVPDERATAIVAAVRSAGGDSPQVWLDAADAVAAAGINGVGNRLLVIAAALSEEATHAD